MKKRNMILLINFFFIFIFIAGYSQKVSACGCGSSHSTSSPSYSMSPQPIMVPSMPEFETKWSTMRVVESFEEKGLTVERLRSIFEDANHDTAINAAEEAVRFDLASFGKEAGVCIHTFTSKDDLKNLQTHFLELNEKGDLYTWSYVKDNVLLVITGTIPEEIARQYERVLYDLRK